MLFAVLLVLALSHGQQAGQAGATQGSRWTATEIPNLEMTALSGDPAPETMVATRLRARRGLRMLPHSHPVDEQLTVIKGSVALEIQGHPGTKRRLKPGETILLKSGVSHSVTFGAGAVVELRGKGRLVTTWVDPAAVRALKPNPADSNSERTKMKREQDKK
ncbi:MAG: cupin domain-containing protein [Acidobacteriia bacterium]|nr:cupin domain-containing protein [Terriglobia bacterium]